MAPETFNSHFSNVGVDLAAEIPSSEYNLEVYLTPTDKTFNLQTPTIDGVPGADPVPKLTDA